MRPTAHLRLQPRLPLCGLWGLWALGVTPATPPGAVAPSGPSQRPLVLPQRHTTPRQPLSSLRLCVPVPYAFLSPSVSPGPTLLA